MTIIKVDNLTKDYGNNRGIFDVSFEVKKGEIFGFVGTNGSGKTTTIRHLMGFLKQDSGDVQILGMDSWIQTEEIKKHLGYVPGEIAFPDIKTGKEFLEIQAEFLGITDMTYANSLIKKLQLDPSANLKRMSKGMKQKTAIVAALISDPEILIMDEPTTGLDPLMRQHFIEIILEEKAKGKTIFMSSHNFEEIEDTCDKVALIKDGRIVSIADMDSIRRHNVKTFKIEFNNQSDYEKFLKEGYNVIIDKKHYHQVSIEIYDSEISKLFSSLSLKDVKFINEKKYNLERHFDKIFKSKGEIQND